MTFLRRY